jgi:hypothetical protein
MDADGIDPSERRESVLNAIETSGAIAKPVIPIQEMEAWLLISEKAIRRASGNPNGKVAMHLPRLKDLEATATPKQLLIECIRQASELRGRRLKKLQERKLIRRIPDYIDDWSSLLALSAVKTLQNDLEVFYAKWRRK